MTEKAKISSMAIIRGAGENGVWKTRAHELRMVFYLFKWLVRKKSKEYFITHGNDMKFKFQCDQLNFMSTKLTYLCMYGLWLLLDYHGIVQSLQ